MDKLISSIVLVLYMELVKGQGEYIEVYPKYQRVAEGSRALFTCVSDIENGKFSWGKPTRRINEERDGIKVTQLNRNTSTLEIVRAHIKRHKRTFRCTVESPTNGNMTQFDSTLKVIPIQKINDNFPKITGIRQEEKYKFSTGNEDSPTRVSTQIQCVAAVSKKPFTWRWIRDGLEDLKFSNDLMSGKLQVQDDYLTIYNPEAADYETTYTCVANNEYGTVYSQPIKINMTQAPGESSFPPCTDRNGVSIKHGEMYTPGDDPCIQCECVFGQPGRCAQAQCGLPEDCLRIEWSEKFCCGFICLDDEANSTQLRNGQCIAFDNSVVENGEIYQPEEDPCLKCTCKNGVREMCVSPGCYTPLCGNPQPVPGKCCEFVCLDSPAIPILRGQCIAYDKSVVENGEVYQPEEDPCYKCTCNNSSPELCFSPGCIAPSCANAQPVPGKCCEFICSDDQPKPLLKGPCTAYNLSVVQDGEVYQPEADPCVSCVCRNGYPTMCMSPGCVPPPCENPTPVPGKCCEFTCPTEKPNPIQAILADLYVQQVGKRDAIIHWNVTSSLGTDKIDTFEVSISKDEGRGTTIKVNSRMYALVNDLDPNVVYTIRVKGTSSKGQVLSTNQVEFILRLRGSNGLVLSDAIGQVYESRGAIQYNGYSLPRQFVPLTKQDKSTHEHPAVILNVNSFNRVEISVYNQAPCPKPDCGMLRFYTFSPDGGLDNSVSLLFEDRMDLQWAVSHL